MVSLWCARDQEKGESNSIERLAESCLTVISDSHDIINVDDGPGEYVVLHLTDAHATDRKRFEQRPEGPSSQNELLKS